MSSVKKAIKIYARLKPSDSAACKHELDKHINDDGSTDDILILSSPNAINDFLHDDYLPNSSLNRPDSYKFRFSKVFDDNGTQDEVFDEICQPVLESALQGYNSTIFAYGQTGSGKTYTMTGSRQQWKNRGIIPRSLSYIFDKFHDLTAKGFIASAFLSYLEIYNENGYDLLHTGFSSGRIEDLKKVQLLEDAQQQIHMKNLTVHPIKSEDEAMQLLYLGDHNRIIAETPMNEASTRSHCIFTIHINIREGNSSTVRRSKVHLVDLAGSERLANSTSTGQLFHEARHINLALHYLEQVIVALGDSHRSHIPYRNSMMTSILRDSLGGNCMTTMVATLSLDQKNILETLSTCRFSQRVALVQNAAVLNEETDPMLLIAQLKTENKRLKDIIANSSIKNLDSCSDPLSQEEIGECWKLVEKYVADPDEEAVLSVAPDMRLVQTCFRCLKTAVHMRKDDILGVSPAVDLAQTLPNPAFPTQYNESMNKDQLLACLRSRDAEIDVLKKMMKPYKAKSGRKKNSLHHHSSTAGGRESGSHFEYGDGPASQPSIGIMNYNQSSSRFNSDYTPTYEKVVPTLSYQPGLDILQTNLSHDDGAGATDISLLNFIGSTEKSDQAAAEQDVFPENMFIEGFSDAKRQALDSFKRSYKGREKLINLKKSLSAKLNELDSIETLLRKNHANLKNLKVVLINSDGGGEEDDKVIREAIQLQTQSVQKQERELSKTEKERKQLEEALKGQYAQFFMEFEKQWVSMKEFRERSGIPSDIDLFVGQDIPKESIGAAAFMQEEPKSGKPIAEVTKGIIKGVGGIPLSSPRSHRKRSEVSNFAYGGSHIAPCHSLPSAHSSRSHNSRSAHVSQSSTARKSSNSSKGSKQKTPSSTPRSAKYSQPSTYQFSRSKGIPAAPPATPPPPNVISTTPIQLIHRHQYPDFPSEMSTDNFVGYYKQPRKPEDFPPLVDYSKEDEELIKELPMTGDASVDQEILSFFTRRQAIFRQINSDKNRIGESSSGRSNHSSQGGGRSPTQNASHISQGFNGKGLDFSSTF